MSVCGLLQLVRSLTIGIRYMLWCMSKYRRGFPFEEFVHEPPPKKTVRGYV